MSKHSKDSVFDEFLLVKLFVKIVTLNRGKKTVLVKIFGLKYSIFKSNISFVTIQIKIKLKIYFVQQNLL